MGLIRFMGERNMFILRKNVLTALGVLGWGLAVTTAHARPAYLDAWKLKYPTSTIPARMETALGLECYTCHNPTSFFGPANCYRADIIALLQGGSSITDALNALDGEDSDLDGFANGVEATMPRTESADVGFNQGLVGPTGTDPCGPDPGFSLTGVSETPPDPIPTVSQWGLLIMSLLLLAAGMSILTGGKRSAAM